MQLILLREPGTPQEQLFYLKPGINTLGADNRNDIALDAKGVLPHHLNIEFANDWLVITGTKSNSSFYFQGKVCQRATVRPGEFFSVGGANFFCQATAPAERTQQAILSVPLANAAPARGLAVSGPAPPLRDVQISGFVLQKPVTSIITVGRSSQCDLILDHPQVSAFHARITKDRGETFIEDLRSSNGTYLSDTRIMRKTSLRAGDSIVIMPYFIIFTGDFLNVYTFQHESRLIGWQVSIAAGAKRIVERVTISCSSNELVGLIGPSGSGKTTLMKSLSGQTLPAAGRVQLNGLEIYSHFDLFKGNIGFVPQDDIIHRELTVHQTLMYAARLRLPLDMSDRERKLRVWETLIQLELEEQERTSIHQLSGGQRKRVNIAIELLTKPGVLFMDEPTSGLDPALDEKLMMLFKKLSQDGRITILTTHLLEHAAMFSKIALMHQGRLIFFGTPAQALDFFDVRALAALYSRIKERNVEEWQDEFQKTSAHQSEMTQIREQILPSRRKETVAPEKIREPIGHQMAQWSILSRRYLDIILRDKKNTGILLLQAPLIAFFITIATSNISSRLFMMALAALWFGCNNSAREICKELPLYRRERMVNLFILPYLGSKFLILSALVALQCTVLALLTPDRFLDAYWPLFLAGLAGISLGLLISSLVDSPDKAIALVPILLIPQVLFSGIFGELRGVQRLMGEFMVSKWSYNLLKKEFELPDYRLKERLEKQIDTSQITMKESQDNIRDLQVELEDVLEDMSNAYDPADASSARYDADRILDELKGEQDLMASARRKAETAEQDLRRNARLFVWIDRPGSKTVDWLALGAFSVGLLACSAAWLRKRDHLLRIL